MQIQFQELRIFNRRRVLDGVRPVMALNLRASAMGVCRSGWLDPAGVANESGC